MMDIYFQQVLLLLLGFLQASESEFSALQSTPRVVAFAAGGGFGASSPSSKGKKKKRKRGGFVSEVKEPTIVAKDSEPKLDKWGLPPPTEDDIFPPLPDGTELIPVGNVKTTSLGDIQQALKEHMHLDYDKFDDEGVERSPSPGNEPMKLKLLYKSPPVLTIENFFTEEECEQTKAVTEGDDAYQVTSATFSPLATSKRTSTSWFCNYNQMPILLSKAQWRLGIPLLQMEEPQIVRYRTGEEFTWHEDVVPNAQLNNGGQRIATLLVYLNTVNRGGGTMFRYLKNENDEQLTVKPKQGTALLFFPAFADGRPDERTLHKGQVAEDVKWITQMWIHERPYKPVVPPGNSHEAAQDDIERATKKLGYTQ